VPDCNYRQFTVVTCLVTRPPLCSSCGSWEKYIRLVPAWFRLLMKGIMCFFEHPPLVCFSRGLQQRREIVNVSDSPRYNTKYLLLSPSMQTQELLNRPRDVEMRSAQFPAPTQVFEIDPVCLLLQNIQGRKMKYLSFSGCLTYHQV